MQNPVLVTKTGINQSDVIPEPHDGYETGNNDMRNPPPPSYQLDLRVTSIGYYSSAIITGVFNLQKIKWLLLGLRAVYYRTSCAF